MLKTLGMILIIASCAAIGFLMSCAISSHVRALESFIHALGIFQAEICVRRTSLPMAAQVAANSVQGSAQRFFQKLADSNKGQFLEQYSIIALEAKSYGLSKTDGEELLKLKSVLGRFDGATQDGAIEDCKARLKLALDAANCEKDSQGKIMRTAGLSIGIIIACIAL